MILKNPENLLKISSDEIYGCESFKKQRLMNQQIPLIQSEKVITALFAH
jgi:hypothetical protein